MPYEKIIVCLANSRKTSGRCIAGKEIDTLKLGKWIRPVSSRPTEEISEDDRRYEDGRHPQVLDIIKIRMIEPKPKTFQTENHLIDDGSYWERMGQLDLKVVAAYLDSVTGPLWINDSSSYNGINDRVAEQDTNTLRYSLVLIRPPMLTLDVATEGEGFGPPRRRIRGSFSLNDHNYKLGVTDPKVETTYLARPNGSYSVENVMLCVSLGEVWRGHAYKLIATILATNGKE